MVLNVGHRGLVQTGEDGIDGRMVLLQKIVATELSKRDLDRPGQTSLWHEPAGLR